MSGMVHSVVRVAETSPLMLGKAPSQHAVALASLKAAEAQRCAMSATQRTPAPAARPQPGASGLSRFEEALATAEHRCASTVLVDAKPPVPAPKPCVPKLPKSTLRFDASPFVTASKPCVPVPTFPKSTLRFDAELYVPPPKPCVPVPKLSQSSLRFDAELYVPPPKPCGPVPKLPKSPLRFDAELYVPPPKPSESSKASCAALCFVPAPKPPVPAPRPYGPAPDAVAFVTVYVPFPCPCDKYFYRPEDRRKQTGPDAIN
jgi:hypothetical protein